ncbi:unnamed protein product, partial [marine sediment metagenome]
HWKGAEASLKRLGDERPSKVEVRCTSDRHDRYLYVDGKVWRSSDSFKDMAKKATTKVIEERESAAELVKDFERRWATARRVYPP